jgi:hypothetical protein
MKTRSKTAKKATKLKQVVTSAKRAAETVKSGNGESKSSFRKKIADNRRVLLSWGKQWPHKNGITVYGTKPVAVDVRAKHAKSAKTNIDNECAFAYALRESVLSPYITDAHVGNATVKIWSALNPDVEVKYMLDSTLAAAVATYDKTKKWPLKDGVYWLMAYPRSLRNGYKQPERKPGAKARKVVVSKRAPTRHISLRNDIKQALATAGSVMKGKKAR